MSTGGGYGGWLCAHCGRPMASAIMIGGCGYHEECTHGPDWVQPRFSPPTPSPVSEERLRQIVREELAAAMTGAGSGE